MIPLKKGLNENISYENLTINALLQVYDKTTPAHKAGSFYLRVDRKDETIADYYVDYDHPNEGYFTKTYRNYFLTLKVENDNKYLIIEPTHFGKSFALSTKEKAVIGEVVEIEISDYYQEWGNDDPIATSNSGYFADTHYTLRVKAGAIAKDFNFYGSQLKGDYTIDIENYSLQILSDKSENSYALIEMIINKNSEN